LPAKTLSKEELEKEGERFFGIFQKLFSDSGAG
jgi:hypothetical protein